MMGIFALLVQQNIRINGCALKNLHTTEIYHQLRIGIIREECTQLLSISCSHPLI